MANIARQHADNVDGLISIEGAEIILTVKGRSGDIKPETYVAFWIDEPTSNIEISIQISRVDAMDVFHLSDMMHRMADDIRLEVMFKGIGKR